MVKVLYAGSPEAAAVCLQKLYEAVSDNTRSCYNKFQIAGVLTNPPSAKGRKKELTPTPVGELARKLNIPVFENEHLDSQARTDISSIEADILVCFAYGRIFGPKFMAMFKHGGINLHPSLLPKYRGCTPVPAAILNRDSSTAFTVQTITAKMDEGDILCQKVVDLNFRETAGSLLTDSAICGAQMFSGLLEYLNDNGRLPQGKVQEGQASYTGIITKEDALIDWNSCTADIDAKIRAYTPEPCCFTHMADGLELKILEVRILSEQELAECSVEKTGVSGTVAAFVKKYGILVETGDSFLCVTKLQKAQKNAMGYKDFMNGARDFILSRLS